MRKAILILCCLFLLVGSSASQRKRSPRKPKPTTDILNGGLVPIPADEMLYRSEEQNEILGHTGWRVATKGAKHPDGSQVVLYYDRERITRSTTGIRAWIKYESVKESKMQSYEMRLEEYDCTKQQTRTLSATLYDGDFQEVRNLPLVEGWSFIAPDTVGETVFGIV